ncbi:hypothetical protein K458DRAFT_96881 [Lentithecium fluviatile CBS 122367]|uniref:Uncharacterized protein n=1 Tax=Lentithecium fluviatile CBS 122367 TaxID=1168545 RepID=A0A6G1JIH6_9PLEO|nr:hypothetical protein K458DRAFT_96881 [Lentithecium fluviatile CBS 122367]
MAQSLTGPDISKHRKAASVCCALSPRSLSRPSPASRDTLRASASSSHSIRCLLRHPHERVRPLRHCRPAAEYSWPRPWQN